MYSMWNFYTLTLHRNNVYDRQIPSDLLQNFIHEILRDCFAVQYIVSWTLVSQYDGTRDLVTPLHVPLLNNAEVHREITGSHVMTWKFQFAQRPEVTGRKLQTFEDCAGVNV